MSSERPTTTNTLETGQIIRIFEQTQSLKLTHEAEHSVMQSAADKLKEEGVFNTHKELFVAAWGLHEQITRGLNELIVAEKNKTLSPYHVRLLRDVENTDIEFAAIKNEVIKILTTLGYEEQEVPENQTALESEAPAATNEVAIEVGASSEPEMSEVALATEVQENNPSEIAKLTELYRLADISAFRINPSENRIQYKTFDVIESDIQGVLTNAGFNSGMVLVFMNEAVNRLKHEINELLQRQAAESNSDEKQRLRAIVTEKYQEILTAVAGFMLTEKVDEAEGLVDSELPTEGLDNLDDAIESTLQEFATLEQSGLYTDNDTAFKKAAVAAGRLQSYTETDEVRASHDKERYLRKLQAALAEIKGQTEDNVPEVILTDTTAPEIAMEVAERAILDEAVAEPVVVTPEFANLEPVEEVSLKNPGVLSVEEVAGKKKHEALFEVKSEYKEKQQAYKEALADFYEEQKSNATIQSQIGAGFRKITGLGLSPELPPAILALQNEYKQLRAVYAESLNQALIERSQREGNREHSLASDGAKIAFGKKFILKPNQEIVALQETAILSPEVKERLGRVMELMAKHKWAARIGIVAAAGIVGGLSGGAGFVLAGAGAASFQASKMALSAVAGAGAGYGANRLTQGGVDKASANFDTTSKGFTLADLDAFETELISAESNLRSAKTRQKVATIGAAVLAGGTTGYSLASVDVDSFLPGNREGLSKEAVDRIVADEIAASGVVDSNNPTADSSPVSTEQKVEAIPEIPGFKIETFTIPYYGFSSGGETFETVIANTKIEGAFSTGPLPEANRLELIKEIKLSMDGSLYAHPSIPEGKLEAEVLSKVQAKFADAPWYREAGITKINIGHMYNQEYTMPGLEPVEVSEKIITGASQEKIGSTYVVQKGDTLSEITEKRFAEQLKDIPANKRGVLLDELFRNIQADADLRGSLGIRSGDVDLIYPNEKLNLDGVEAELTRLVEREQILENFRTSGPLSVEADADVKNVPITVVEKPVPATVDVTADSGRVYKEAVPTPVPKPVELVAPRPYSLNGQFADTPAYKEYLQKVFGTAKLMERAVETAATNFDKTTYDIFESFGTYYESPYRFLGDMTLQQVTEFETQPNDQIRAFLNDNKIKYETYLAWLDKIDEMAKALPNQSETRVSDLFTRYVAETQSLRPNSLLK